MRLAIVLVLTSWLLGSPSPAAAEPTSIDAVTEGLEIAPDLRGLDWRAGAQAFAGVDRERGTAGISVGGSVAWEKLGCRIVDVGAEAVLSRSGPENALSGNAHLGLCILVSDITRTRFRFGDRLMLSIEPSLATRRVVMGGRHSGNVFWLDTSYLALALDDDDVISFFDMAAEVGVYWADAGATPEAMDATMDMTFAMITWRRTRLPEDLRLELMHLEANTVGIGESAFVLAIDPIRLTGVRVGPLLVDGWAGVTMSTVWPDAPPEIPREMLEPTHDIRQPIGHAGVRLPQGRALTLGLEVDRDAWPTLAGDVVVDSRLIGSVTAEKGRLSGFARAWAGWADTYAQDGSASSAPTLGGDVRLAANLGRGLSASVVAESVRTGDEPWAFRSLAVLSAVIER